MINEEPGRRRANAPAPDHEEGPHGRRQPYPPHRCAAHRRGVEHPLRGAAPLRDGERGGRSTRPRPAHAARAQQDDDLPARGRRRRGGGRAGAVINALTFGRSGWATLVAPGDIDAVHTVHMSTTVWHRTGDGYRLTEVQPDGRVRAGEGATMHAAREDLASPARRPDRGGTRGAPGRARRDRRGGDEGR